MKRILEFFIETFTDLADAFLDMNLVRHDWGIHLEREDCDDLVLGVDEIPNSYLRSINGASFFRQIAADKEGILEFWKRDFKKESYPFTEEFQIVNFSFSDRKKNSAQIYDSLEFLPRYMGILPEDVKSFERIPRGLLHISEGARLWVLQDPDQKPLALVLSFGKNDKEMGLIYLSTNKNFRRRGYAEILVQAILSKQKKGTTTYIIRENQQPSDGWLQKFGFERQMSFSSVE